jgi:outer membrane biosynthesis protein TonB
MSKLADRLTAIAPKSAAKAPKAPLPPKAPKPAAPSKAKPAPAKPAKPAPAKPSKVKPAAKPAKPAPKAKPAAVKPSKVKPAKPAPKAAKVKNGRSRRDNTVGDGEFICTLIVHLPGQGSKSRTIRGVDGKNFESAMRAAPKYFSSVLKEA